MGSNSKIKAENRGDIRCNGKQCKSVNTRYYYDPNTFDWGEYTDGRRKIIDQLTPKRRALFEEFGGVVHNPNAEILGDEVEDG